MKEVFEQMFANLGFGAKLNYCLILKYIITKLFKSRFRRVGGV